MLILDCRLDGGHAIGWGECAHYKGTASVVSFEKEVVDRNERKVVKSSRAWHIGLPDKRRRCRDIPANAH